jgi:hypothetical protein
VIQLSNAWEHTQRTQSQHTIEIPKEMYYCGTFHNS